MVTMDRQAYERHKRQAAGRQATLSATGRDIGLLPPVRNPERKARAIESFQFFMEAYLGMIFCLSWSQDHLHAIAKTEQAANRGGLFAMAMPRGTGKTSICDAATLWAPMTGRRRFAFLFAANQTGANDHIESIKKELATNELLAEDWPEIVYPIRCLEGIANRAAGQLYMGRPTWIKWKADRIVLPTIAGSRASGAVIRAAGLDTNFRGANYMPPEGGRIRPDWAVIDDPQTDESAKSFDQCNDREKRIKGGILGLAGNDRTIAAVMPCTVIYPNDLAARFLDKKANPAWRGHIAKLLYDFPERREMWEEYWAHYTADLDAGGDGSSATDYYLENQVAMDEGARAGWPERHPGCASAIEYAMRLFLTDPAAFAAEYQNDPIVDQAETTKLDRTEIVKKTNGHKAGIVPHGCRFIVAHVDVQKKALWWTVVGWEDAFRGHVIAYGTWPSQHLAYYTLRDLRYTIQRAYPGLSFEGALYAALGDLTEELLGKEWPIDGGGGQRVDRMGIDANWGESTDTIYRFCRQSKWAASLRPMHGTAETASSKPLIYPGRKRKKGEIVGEQWIIPAAAPIRHITFEGNYWKSKTAGFITTPIGEHGALDIHAGDARLLADHWTSEYPVRTEGRGRTIDEWKLLPGRDNHYWDNVIGSAVLASTLGITSGHKTGPRRQSKRRPKKATKL